MFGIMGLCCSILILLDSDKWRFLFKYKLKEFHEVMQIRHSDIQAHVLEHKEVKFIFNNLKVIFMPFFVSMRTHKK